MSKREHDKLEDVISFVRAEGRVCPKPDCWDELWRMLPGRKRVGINEHLPLYPPVPIFAAWQNTPDEQKRERLIIQLKYAAKHGVLEKVEEFLKSIKYDQWSYEGDNC